MLHAPIEAGADSSLRPSADDVIGLLRLKAGDLPQIDLDYRPAIKTLWLTIKPEPKPVFTFTLLDSINKVQRAIHDLWSPALGADSPVRFLAYRGDETIFTLGGDLEFYLECVARGDRATLEAYAEVSKQGAIWNASCLNGAALTLSTVHAKALGGGIDAARSCNIMIAERQATFCYPEVKFNHFPITAVAVLSRHTGPLNALKILSEGGEYSAEQFAALGGLETVVDEGQGEKWIEKYAQDCLPIHSARLSLFSAFYRQTAQAFETELTFLAQNWVDCMLRMSQVEIARLERISAAQNRMLARAKPAPKTVAI